MISHKMKIFLFGKVHPIKNFGPVAQRLEQAAHNRPVEGSSPSRPTKSFKDEKVEQSCPKKQGGEIKCDDLELLWKYLAGEKRESEPSLNPGQAGSLEK